MHYRILVKGHLDASWQSWFEGLQLLHLCPSSSGSERSGTTILSGSLPDQSALYGVLLKIDRLGLTLLAVESAEHPDSDKGENEMNATSDNPVTQQEQPFNKVTSKDGTTIAYNRLGEGPAVVLVCGGSVDSSSNAGLAELLAKHFTVYNYERRGRGASGDTPPYAVEREVEDIEAVIDEAGGSAYLYGISSGAALALEAARQLPGKVKKLALYEPPFIIEGTRSRPPADTASIYTKMISEGRRGDAVEYFMTKVVGLPEEFAAQAHNEPWWPWQEALAHTLAYDATIMGDYSLPTKRVAAVSTPTLVIAGGATFGWVLTSTQALADILPNSEYRVVEGQAHDIAPQALAPVLEDFFGDKAS